MTESPIKMDKSAETLSNLSLPPDTTILIEARIKAGAKTLQIKQIANLLLHDPVSTIELLQVANSIMYAGASVSDLESAITRVGSAKLIDFIATLNGQPSSDDLDVYEAFDILRYNCRRVSILSMIIAALLRPTITSTARAAGLCADLGHMLALNQFGKLYCDIAKSKGRKNLAFRLQKDHKFDLNKQLVKYLVAKGAPRSFIVAYNLDEDVKNPAELDLRCCVQSALELIEAFDAGKFENYNPKKSLPPQSTLRLLKITSGQHEKLFNTATSYLSTVATQEAPEGASLLISGFDDEPAPEETAGDTIVIPKYPDTAVNQKSREALQAFFALCDESQDADVLARQATEYLRDKGLFNRTALVRVDPEGEHATVATACGVPVAEGQSIDTGDYLSPFKTLRTEIRSTNLGSSEQSPFGESAYALGPADVLPTGEHLLLYADSAGSPALTLESRRVFRLALGLLMRSLQRIRATAK